jgi:hypothetical protein
MATVLFLGGIFNILDPVLGLPLYIWLWLGTLFMAGISWLIWYSVKWKPYTPLHGLYHAWKAGSSAAFIFDMALHGEMVAEREAKCIFDYSKWEYELEDSQNWFVRKIKSFLFYYPTAFLPDIDLLHAIVYKFGKVNKDVEIARMLQKGEWERSPSLNCGGVDIDVIIDTNSWTLPKTVQHKAIVKAARLWNEANPDDQVHSYTKFQRKLLAGNIICPEVKKSAFVDWTRINKGFTVDLESSEYFGKAVQMSENQTAGNQSLKKDLAIWMLLGGCGVAIFIAGIRLLTHYWH